MDSLTGYIPIYFSAKLIDALASRQPLNVLVLYAALTVGLVFLVKLLRVWIVGIKHTYENVIDHNEDWMFSDKAMQMAYESIENPEVTRLKYRIRRESQTGFNLFHMLHCITAMVSEGSEIIASLALTLSFFVLPSV